MATTKCVICGGPILYMRDAVKILWKYLVFGMGPFIIYVQWEAGSNDFLQ